MDFLITTIVIFCAVSIIFLIIQQIKYSNKINALSLQNRSFLESIEKYIEIFNEQNVNELVKNKNLINEKLANEKIESIKEAYKEKLSKIKGTLNEEHEMLIDFVTLSLSLLIKTPPGLRKQLILENTNNEVIKKILLSKLDSIKKHYIPVSLIEVAISKESS